MTRGIVPLGLDPKRRPPGDRILGADSHLYSRCTWVEATLGYVSDLSMDFIGTNGRLHLQRFRGCTQRCSLNKTVIRKAFLKEDDLRFVIHPVNMIWTLRNCRSFLSGLHIGPDPSIDSDHESAMKFIRGGFQMGISTASRKRHDRNYHHST